MNNNIQADIKNPVPASHSYNCNHLIEIALLVITLIGVGLSLGCALQRLPSAYLLPGELTALLGTLSLIICVAVCSQRRVNSAEEVEESLPAASEEEITNNSSQQVLEQEVVVEKEVPLPEEMLVSIFSLLEPSALGCVRQVNRQWAKVANDEELWERAFNLRWPESSAIFYQKELSWKKKCQVLRGAQLTPPLYLQKKQISRLALQGEILFTNCNDHRIELWDLTTGRIIKEIVDDPSTLITFFRVCGQAVVTLNGCGSLRIRDISSSENFTEIAATRTAVIAIEGGYLFQVSKSNRLKIFNLETRKPDLTEDLLLTGYDTNITSLAVNDKFIAAGDRTGVICVWNRASKTLHQKMCNSIVYGAHELFINKDTLITIHSAIHLWDLHSGALLGYIYFDDLDITCAVMEEGRLALGLSGWKKGEREHCIKIFSLESQSIKHVATIHSDQPIDSMALQKNLLITNARSNNMIQQLHKLKNSSPKHVMRRGLA